MSVATVLNNSSFINQTGHKYEVMIYAEGLYETEKCFVRKLGPLFFQESGVKSRVIVLNKRDCYERKETLWLIPGPDCRELTSRRK